jgi:hypothetical protein
MRFFNDKVVEVRALIARILKTIAAYSQGTF